MFHVCSSGSTLCTFHLLTPNPPVILSSNDSVQLAPFHTYYAKLEEHMAQAGIGKNHKMSVFMLNLLCNKSLTKQSIH